LGITPVIQNFGLRGERLLRLAALGRKNYYGCHAEWSAAFTATCLSIIQTAAMHGLNVEAYLRYILDELALHQGEHPDVDLLLPWNIPESKLQAYTMKTGGPPCTNTNFSETSAVGL
jgi:transposase